MRDAMMLVIVAAVFTFGWYVVKRFSRFLEENPGLRSDPSMWNLK